MVPMPELDDAEKKAMNIAASALQPFAESLMNMAASPMTDDQIIESMFPWIPEAMIQPLGDLAAVVAKHGPVVLQVIHQGMVNDRWKTILPKLVDAFREEP